MRLFIEPIQSEAGAGEGGMTSAMDLPNRVIRIGFFVFRTESSSARHFTVNSKIAISLMTAIGPGSTLDQGQHRLWQSKGIHCAARCNCHTLFSVDRKGHGRGIDCAAHLKMPDRFAGCRVKGDEVSFRVAAEHQAACG